MSSKLSKHSPNIHRWTSKTKKRSESSKQRSNIPSWVNKISRWRPKAKKKSKLSKRKSDISRWAAKAKKRAEEASELINQFELSGYEIENKQLITNTLVKINEIESKAIPRDYDLELIKDFASVKQYDVVKVLMPIRDNTDDDISVPQDQEVSLRDIRLAQRRQVLSPEKLSEEEHQILSNYANAFGKFASANAPDLTSPEKQKDFKKKFNITRDVSIGGSSTLINDLSYTYDALESGRYFVEEIQKIMSNPDDFVQIEAWYRQSPYIKRVIDEAVKSMWYQKFKEFSTAIIEAINNMPNISSEGETKLQEMETKLEVIADEELF